MFVAVGDTFDFGFWILDFGLKELTLAHELVSQIVLGV